VFELKLLGGVDLRSGDAEGPRRILAQPKRLALLVYLALAASGRSVRRDTLLALLWSESDLERARSSLRSSLHFLRRALGEETVETIGAEEVRIAPGVMRCDAVEFATLCERESWLEAVELYSGPLLPGFFVSAAPEWEDWLDSQRDRFRRMAVRALGRAAETHEAAGEPGLAAEMWRQVVAVEPLRLEALLRLMDVLAAAGERASAIAEGNAFQTRMRREYDADPDPEVARRIDQLRATPTAAPGAEPPISGAGSATSGAASASGTELQPSAGAPATSEVAPSSSGGATTPHGRVPRPPTPLIGRDTELVAVLGTLTRERTRLLTLTGPGGIGKTRLALEAATESQAFYRDGALFVDLTPLSEPDQVVRSVAAALGVSESGTGDLLDALTSHLSSRSVLLVLDNFEHLMGAAQQVATLLEAAPGLKVLATSREALRLRLEQEHPVPPLRPYAAMELYAARSRAVRPGFELSERDAATVAEICRRLDGLPLAIELAAARMKLLPPHAILQRLERSLVLLTGGARDLPARHQTLRATIGWSYDLLGDAERRVFDRLAVFAGSFTPAAAEVVCGPAESVGVEVIDGLASLVDKSLLVRRDDEEREAGRLRMLDTIHEFARERLAESIESEAVRSRHAAFFADQAEEAYHQMRGPVSRVVYDTLAPDHENFRAALGWALESGQTEIALRMAAALQPYWQLRGHLGEGRGWLRAALEADCGTDSPARAEALCSAGFMAMRQNDFSVARSYGEQSLDLFRRHGSRRGVGTTLHLLGLVASQERELDRAFAYLDEMLSLHRQDGNSVGVSLASGGLGMVATLRGDYDRAATLYAESLALDRAAGDRPRTGTTLLNLGVLEIEKRDYEQASAYLRESLDVHRDIESQYGIALGLFFLAGVAGKRQRPERSARLYAAGASVLRAIGTEVEPSARTGIDQHLAAARAQLDPVAWQTAWADGERMPLEDAIDYALED
jgi:predicted ATPase/DNA-binding SARP family transcriptional activator